MESEPSDNRGEQYVEMTEHREAKEAFPADHIGSTVASPDPEAPQQLSLKAERTKERLVEIFKVEQFSVRPAKQRSISADFD